MLTTVQILHSNIESLVLKARAGDKSAFDRLADHYRAYPRSVAFVRTSSFDDADDLVQQILIKAWRALPTLSDPAAFPAWLRQIAGNALHYWSRTVARSPSFESMESSIGISAAQKEQPIEIVLVHERQAYLRSALVELSEANRTALLMHIWGGYSHYEIAETTGVAVTTVEGRIYRAKRQLARRLRDRRLDVFANLIPIQATLEEDI